MSSKHFLNDPTALVSSALRSITLTNLNVAFDAENKIVYLRPDATTFSSAPSRSGRDPPTDPPRVALVSGGGSGHEPAFAGYVGPGLLSGAVAGTIFASPTATQIRRCLLQRVPAGNEGGGTLVIVMNYTGDVLNFGMAVEKARAAGRAVAMVVVGDDAGVGRARGGKVGRRGIAGTVLVLKVAGALAARGAELEDVTRVARIVAENVVSIGASLSHVHVPGRAGAEEGEGAEEGRLGMDEVEIGMGIHNEPGSERTKADLAGTVKIMLKYMLNTSDQDRGFLHVDKQDETVLMINNLGGVSVLELGGITSEVVAQLEKDYGIRPVRILAGTYMTSLNGLGFSITLLKVVDLGVGVSLLELLDAPAEAAGWTAAVRPETWSARPSQTREDNAAVDDGDKACGLTLDPERANKALQHALQRVIKAEPEITRYDTVVGDGDCGTGLKRGAEAILAHLDKSAGQTDAALYLDDIISQVEETMDGTSGALYAIFLNALATGLRGHAGQGAKQADTAAWAQALGVAMESLGRYTPAKPGDRTLVDALAPFIDELRSSGDVQKAAEAAEQGAQQTKGMKASLGRTVYVGGSGFEEVPDPGAYGLAQFFMGLAEGLN